MSRIQRGCAHRILQTPAPENGDVAHGSVHSEDAARELAIDRAPTRLDFNFHGAKLLVAEFTGVFTNADGNLFVETYNQLNAYFATVPGNYALNLRRLYVLNTNYADLSFLFTILPGEKTNAHLGTEYLAVVETDNSTPYFLNLHTRDVAHNDH